MEYFRKYLIFIRREENDNVYPLKVSTIFLLVLLAGIISGIVMDMLAPHNYFLNMIRGVIAIFAGIAGFSYGYILSDKKLLKKKEKDKYYRTIRERFSFKQRINSSIVMAAGVVIFVLLSKPDGVLFTLKAIIAVFLTMLIISFVRRSRSEFIKDIYEIPDLRDIKNKVKKREESPSNKKLKK